MESDSRYSVTEDSQSESDSESSESTSQDTNESSAQTSKEPKKDTKHSKDTKDDESSSTSENHNEEKPSPKTETTPDKKSDENQPKEKESADEPKSTSADSEPESSKETKSPPPKPETQKNDQSATNNESQPPSTPEKPPAEPAKKTDTETPSRKTDRYGWVSEKVTLSQREKKLIQIERSKEEERTKKWLAMTKDFPTFLKQHRNKVASRIKKGVPDTVRGKVWACLTQSEEMKAKYPPMNELLDKPPQPGYTTIDKDLPRTFPQIGRFSETNTLESLRNILYCYCQTDTVLGYTQGMSFIAGMLLNYMDEDAAFYSFVNVMLGERLNQRGYLLSGFPRLEHANLMLMCLMQKYCPKVLKRMNDLNLDISMFTPQWFLTCFQSYNWQPEFQLRIFERYLFYGTRSLLNLGIVIILYHRKELEKANMETFLNILQHPDTSPKMLNWHSVLDDWDKQWLTKGEYEKLLNRCHVQKETTSY